ncbi:tigger transposable element-derived protein 6-like [Cotesia glomerata]|uniref:tigger transposable element-derived protein 6-like n=1 Tax=Cotesia glomerata TaxID=32391 RepID=UPI001D003F39|nr:tigger transposable element-derived protein 6-like [Cotesia glomerata]
MSVKRKLKTLSLSEKLRVLEAVKTIIRKKVESGQSLSCKRRRISEFPGLEECLLKWFKQCRHENISISGPLLQEKAEIYSTSLGFSDFRASNGWLEKFKRRHDLVFKKVCGESASVNVATCNKWTNDRLKDLLRDFEPENVFNADETALFYKCLPDKTLTFRDDKCHGGKHSKERLTILLAANMTGTEKLSPSVIGKSKKPRCFSKCKSLPLKYEANTKAWMTSAIFRDWLIGIDKKMSKEKRKILLFIDNCTAHNDIPQMTSVRVEFLPPNTTSKLQPMDQGIIKNFKSLYRKEVVRNMLQDLEEKRDSRIDVLQAMRMADKAWRNVTATTIKNCFAHCGFSSSIIEEEVEDISLQPPEEWDTVVPEICFEDFITCDDGVMTAGILSDEEILNSVSKSNERDEYEIEDPSNITCTQLVSIKEARIALNTLRNFIEQTSISEEKEFSALCILDNAIDKEQPYLKQKKITDFFQ